LAWGSNNDGQLGDGSNLTRLAPVRVIDGGVCAISAGRAHSIALSNNGDVLAWGANDVGQLGDGTNLAKLQPVVILQKNICEISAGWYHNLAREPEFGMCWSWGGNKAGQVGDGTSDHQRVPVQILESHAIEVHPSYLAISWQQFGDLGTSLKSHFGARFRCTTVREAIRDFIAPATAHRVNVSYARLLNEGSMLPLDVFISHCWDCGLEELTGTTDRVLGRRSPLPNLWLAVTALWQGGYTCFFGSCGSDALRQAPFQRAMHRAGSMLFVRSELVDPYTRLWCVWELFLAVQLGFPDRPGAFLVAGSNRGFESSEPVELEACSTSHPEDRERLLKSMTRSGALLKDVEKVASNIRKLYYR